MSDPFQLMLAGRLAEAEALFCAALQAAPDDRRLRYGRGVTLMALGRYAEGVDDYELRHSGPPGPWPLWRGEPVDGRRITIFPEQGLGDQIAFARFASVLRDQGADVTLLCAPQLVRLFSGLGVRVLAASGAVEFPDPDYVCFAGSLLRCARSADEVPGTPYLFGVPRPSAGRIGVMTRGNPRQHNDANRSLPPEFAAELLDLPGAVSLQPEDTGAADLQDTADIIAGLDLVISVCTSVAHLAGALGKPLWVMPPAFDTDWRWMRGRSDSPWYPSARIYRQAQPGDWRGVIDRVRSDLGL